MSKISKTEVERIAYLARIELNADEKNQLVTQLSSILDFVAKLQQVESKDVAETSQVTGLVDVWREDVVVPCEISPGRLLKNAPRLKDGYIVVRRVLK